MKTKTIRILAFSFNVIILCLLVLSLENIGYFLNHLISFRFHFYETIVILIRLIGFIHSIMFFIFFFNKSQNIDEFRLLEKRERILELTIENERLKKSLNEIENL